MIPEFKTKNPWLNDHPEVGYVGDGYFGQKRQLPIPMMVNMYRDGEFETLFVGTVD